MAKGERLALGVGVGRIRGESKKRFRGGARDVVPVPTIRKIFEEKGIAREFR